MIELNKPISRVTTKPFAHYKRPIVITLLPGTDKRDEFIAMRLRGTRETYLGPSRGPVPTHGPLARRQSERCEARRA
jgi:hypothetical protein